VCNCLNRAMVFCNWYSHVTGADLAACYQAMAANESREIAVREWLEALAPDSVDALSVFWPTQFLPTMALISFIKRNR
jgi:hypothetical protein